MFDIFIVMLMYYLLSFCVVCRHVLFVLRFVYTGEFISIRSYSGTPLIRPPTGHENLVVLTG